MFLATLIGKSIYSDSHLPLIMTIWNHRLGRARRAVALPALLPQTIKLPRRASRYTLPQCTQHQCVYWIQDPVINKFSIFSPSGASPTSKEVKDGVVSLCACAFYCIKQPGFQPQDTGGEQPRKFNFMTATFATWQVGLWFACFVGFARTWFRADHAKCQHQIWNSLCQRSKQKWKK